MINLFLSHFQKNEVNPILSINSSSLSVKRPLKIVFTGPESSGKTTTTRLAAKHFNTYWLSEYSRTYLNKLNRSYVVSDLVKIAEGQLSSEREFEQYHTTQAYLFYDTSLLVIKVWSIFKYGFYNFELERLLRQNLPDIFFLCDWNIPWEFDPMRENPNERNILYHLYKKELAELNIPFFELKGTTTERLMCIKKTLQNIDNELNTKN